MRLAALLEMLNGAERSLITIKLSIQYYSTFLFISGVNKNVEFNWPAAATMLNTRAGRKPQPT